MFFNSIKDINWLRKEINRLLCKEMSLLRRKTDLLKISIFKVKKICHRVSFGKLQLMKISLNFKTFCGNLKIRGLAAKLCVAFILFSF